MKTNTLRSAATVGLLSGSLLLASASAASAATTVRDTHKFGELGSGVIFKLDGQQLTVSTDSKTLPDLVEGINKYGYLGTVVCKAPSGKHGAIVKWAKGASSVTVQLEGDVKGRISECTLQNNANSSAPITAYFTKGAQKRAAVKMETRVVEDQLGTFAALTDGRKTFVTKSASFTKFVVSIKKAAKKEIPAEGRRPIQGVRTLKSVKKVGVVYVVKSGTTSKRFMLAAVRKSDKRIVTVSYDGKTNPITKVR